MGLTEAQVYNLILIERVTASISVFATLILLTTFGLFKEFRTLSNTLIFLASFANLFANVAALIGGNALSKESSALCQFQAFLLEMFMQSDPMWSLAMAVNVYLVFLHRYEAARLRKLYWVYGVICYGVPFIPAMVCLLLKVNKKSKIYGNATVFQTVYADQDFANFTQLWCWIDNDWAALRIYSYYAPVWICILLALLMYLRVGFEIFQKRSELRAVANSGSNSFANNSSIQHERNSALSPRPFTGTRTTEVKVTHDDWSNYDTDMAIQPPQAHMQSSKPSREPYSIIISARKSSAPRGLLYWMRRPRNMDRVKWAYFKVAMLFAVSILITWVPASINRVHGLRYPDRPSYILNIGSALVLPLQGFWNTVIYFTTSLSICRKLASKLNTGKTCDDGEGFRRLDVGLGSRRESECAVELQRKQMMLKKEDLLG
ncbi:G-protein-like protein coupled receptor [Calycina marina]|uniref:G-protein-like protein coupled receptor n=1 Tax=Calycina marina TaxID=1763456 RepID=A0A9P8CFB6_9HELO|nr:G-protein-like protein coupled receptor [Calycina marina]